MVTVRDTDFGLAGSLTRQASGWFPRGRRPLVFRICVTHGAFRELERTNACERLPGAVPSPSSGYSSRESRETGPPGFPRVTAEQTQARRAVFPRPRGGATGIRTRAVGVRRPPAAAAHAAAFQSREKEMATNFGRKLR